MGEMKTSVRVRVPASSANLGPGFDCFGIAWQLYDLLSFSFGGSGLEISGCPEKYRNSENLAYRGFEAVRAACGAELRPLKIDFLDSAIPVSRGLGSSAALIAGGAAAANVLYGLDLSRQELLDIVTPVEGHPDNLAPCLFGGFTASTMAGGKALTAPYPLSEKLRFTVLVPDFELSTHESRGVLPQSVPRVDAVFNVSRTALLIKALELGDREMLAPCLEDKLHQPFRFALIKGYDTALKLARAHDVWGMCISGAGSTLLCVSDRADFADSLRPDIERALPGWRVIPVEPENEGCVIL